jgi:hypothetical protein
MIGVLSMNLLSENQVKQVSAGFAVVLPFKGEHTFKNGFWNGASLFAPMMGFALGSLLSFVLFPLDLVGIIDINSHLDKE